MIRTRAQPAPPGGVRLTVPAGYESRWLGEPDDEAAAERWIWSSPDSCLYHAPSYVDFSRAQNGRADLLWLVRDGNPVLGVPLHAAGDRRFSTGYAGLLFPPGRGEGPVRRGVLALAELLEANRALRLHVIQSSQAPAYDTPGRLAAIARRFEERRLTGPSLYSRILALPEPEPEPEPDPEPKPKPKEVAPHVELSGEPLLTVGLEPYESALRNQIRQAVRHGLSVTCALPTQASEIHDAYGEFVPLHRVSWHRTGMQPHDERYWETLSQAVISGGGRDVIVYVRDQAGRAIAAAVCHVRNDRALYWAGCSNDEGLRTRANPLCLHAAIQTCRQIGVRWFELGRFNAREPSDKERSVTRYKAQFGGELVRIVGFETGVPLAATLGRRVAALRLRRS